MIVIINGDSRETNEITVMGLLTSLNVHPQTVVVELNGEILSRDHFSGQSISSGDNIEIVQMMAGG